MQSKGVSLENPFQIHPVFLLIIFDGYLLAPGMIRIDLVRRGVGIFETVHPNFDKPSKVYTAVTTWLSCRQSWRNNLQLFRLFWLFRFQPEKRGFSRGSHPALSGSILRIPRKASPTTPDVPTLEIEAKCLGRSKIQHDSTIFSYALYAVTGSSLLSSLLLSACFDATLVQISTIIWTTECCIIDRDS